MWHSALLVEFDENFQVISKTEMSSLERDNVLNGWQQFLDYEPEIEIPAKTLGTTRWVFRCEDALWFFLND